MHAILIGPGLGRSKECLETAKVSQPTNDSLLGKSWRAISTSSWSATGFDLVSCDAAKAPRCRCSKYAHTYVCRAGWYVRTLHCNDVSTLSLVSMSIGVVRGVRELLLHVVHTYVTYVRT